MSVWARIGGGHVWRAAMVVPILILVCGPVILQTQVTAQEGAPPSAADDGEGLEAMLARVPADLPELEEPENAIVTYANIAAQLEAVGGEPPESVDDEEFGRWISATFGLAMPSTAAQYLRLFRQDFGFDLLQADQTLEISYPPFNLAMYRGRFDQAAVTAALRDLGYEPGGVDGQIVLSIRDDFDIDLRAGPSYALASMNYATVLEDGTLVFAPARSIIEAVLDVEAGDAESMAERRDVADLLPHVPESLASALLFSGTQLAGGPPPVFLDPAATPDLDAMATEIAAEAEERERMPPVALALLGVTPGGPLVRLGEATPERLPPDAPEASGVVVLLMAGPAAAREAAPVIEERLATGSTYSTRQPFAEFFSEWTVSAVPDEAVVVVELTLAEGTAPNILARMLYQRDLAFLAW